MKLLKRFFMILICTFTLNMILASEKKEELKEFMKLESDNIFILEKNPKDGYKLTEKSFKIVRDTINNLEVENIKLRNEKEIEKEEDIYSDSKFMINIIINIIILVLLLYISFIKNYFTNIEEIQLFKNINSIIKEILKKVGESTSKLDLKSQYTYEIIKENISEVHTKEEKNIESEKIPYHQNTIFLKKYDIEEKYIIFRSSSITSNKNIAIYLITYSNNEGTLSLVESNSEFLLRNRSEYILPVAIEKGNYNNNVRQITNVKSGSVIKIGDDWKLKEKVEIIYG